MKTLFTSLLAGFIGAALMLAVIPAPKKCTVNHTFNRVECCLNNQCDIYNL